MTVKKLTPTMLAGLRKMALKLKRQSETLPEPNENTGKALEARGLIEFTRTNNGWKYYVLTEAGRTEAAKVEGHDA